MPELPEVEITRQKLAPFFEGRRVEKVDATAPSYFFVSKPSVIKRALEGSTIETLSRRGKYLLAHTSQDGMLLLHLGMTGQLFSEGSASIALLSSTASATLPPEHQRTFAPDKHTHLIFHFGDDRGRVFFRDARKFGKVEWIPKGTKSKRLEKLGPDTLLCEKTELIAHFVTRAKKRKAPIKNVLLDQSVMAGVGNIYADEALFRAGVRPRTSAQRIAKTKLAEIATHARTVMIRSIETGGSSISDYIHPDGGQGNFQNERKVYAREGLACYACGTPIKRITIAARSSHYCPICQR